MDNLLERMSDVMLVVLFILGFVMVGLLVWMGLDVAGLVALPESLQPHDCS